MHLATKNVFTFARGAIASPEQKNNEITVDNAMNMNSQCAAAVSTGGRNGKSLVGKEWEVDTS